MYITSPPCSPGLQCHRTRLPVGHLHLKHLKLNIYKIKLTIFPSKLVPPPHFSISNKNSTTLPVTQVGNFRVTPNSSFSLTPPILIYPTSCQVFLISLLLTQIVTTQVQAIQNQPLPKQLKSTANLVSLLPVSPSPPIPAHPPHSKSTALFILQCYSKSFSHFLLSLGQNMSSIWHLKSFTIWL